MGFQTSKISTCRSNKGGSESLFGIKFGTIYLFGLTQVDT